MKLHPNAAKLFANRLLVKDAQVHWAREAVKTQDIAKAVIK